MDQALAWMEGCLRYSRNKKVSSLGSKAESIPFPGHIPGLTSDRWLVQLVLLSENEEGPYPKNLLQLRVHAATMNGQLVEDPLEIIVKVTDQNDNNPQFTRSVFCGCVTEGANTGTPVMQVLATDEDDAVDTDHGLISYSIHSQDPTKLHREIFGLHSETELISVIRAGLDREATRPDASNQLLLTVHVLNTLTGLPATGLILKLSQLGDSQELWSEILKSTTDADGRLDKDRRPTALLTAGTYKLHFETGQYWEQQGYKSFYPYVEIVFTITELEHKVHVPLLVSPYAYSTYRGS